VSWEEKVCDNLDVKSYLSANPRLFEIGSKTLLIANHPVILKLIKLDDI
jgi:hypothetical protein